MFISDFAIRRPIVTITAMLALVAFGIAALLQLKTDEFPDIAQPIVSVTIVYPGASPETVEREVVDRIEERIFGLAGVDRDQTISTATDGLAQLTIFFEFEKPVSEAATDVRDAISEIRGDLPQEIEEPVITRVDPAEQSLLSLNVASDARDARELTRIADPMVIRAIRAVPGVAQADVVGGVYPEMTIEVEPARLEAAGLSVAQVVQAIQAQNLAAPVGRLTGETTERTIRLKGRLDDAADFAALVVAGRNGQLIRLGDVARVYEGTEEQRTAALFNGRPAVGIEVKKSKGYSATDVSDRVKAELERLRSRLPGDVTINVVRDQGERAARAVRNVQEALVEGAVLTVLVVFVFLNSWRSTVITGLALPVSVLASFIAVWAFGFKLETMSLLGLSLAIGILIDDAIVVRENIVRHVEMGKDHYTASREGTDEIGLAVAATTFSIVAVFVPIAFMYGLAGQWFKPFALTIACSVLVSLFVSFSLDPMLSAYWADPHVPIERRGWLSRRLHRFDRWFERQADRYTRVVAWALDHRLAVTLIALGSLVGALALQFRFGGFGFVPVSDRGEMDVIVEAPPSANLEYTIAKTEEVSALLRRHPEVRYTYTTIGTALPMRTPGVDQGLIYVKLTPKAERELSQDELGRVFREELRAIAGADVFVFSGGFSGAFKSIQLQFTGSDAQQLAEYAERVAALVRTVPGATDVGLSTRGAREELVITPLRGLGGSLGLTVGQVAQSLRPAFAGIDAGDWIDPTGETRDVRVRLAPEARARPSDLERLPITLPGSGEVVPLGQVASITRGLAPGQIDHLDREKVITVGANVQGLPLNDVVSAIQEKLEREAPLPPGIRLSQGGEARDQAEVFSRVFVALGIAVLLMYLILVVQFGSFLDPLAILVSLPLSLIGVVLALLVTGDTINIMSLIGVILLMGIVAKNAILLIDFAKWAQERDGRPIRDALIEAGRIRLRPIIMTTLALIAGMVPVAWGAGEGADFRAPLGRAVIGGTVTSTLLTLLVIPTVYEILVGWREAIRARFARAFGRHAAEVPKPAVAAE
ncbi:MAG TPA: efflux RND transporter permease subunit [Gemmatimonadales bacterium]|nr:efflux RND transporter permease subunit [Gemmatimonadales bacterium]